MIVVGIDGCKKGWVAAAWNTGKQSIELAVHSTFGEAIDTYPRAKAIGIDIPIGLIECGRAADREAREVLRCRKPSVFPAPDPRIVGVDDYHTANEMLKKLCGKGVSAQAFGISRKVAEVNATMKPELQNRIVEVHPEVCFWAMNGYEEICPPKRESLGHRARLDLLRARLAISEIEWEKVTRGIRGAQPDDILDALASAWTARRWVNGSFGRFPKETEVDAQGLRAEIIY